MAKEHILIAGAGAAGLMAAGMLAEKGYRVTILEARDRTGGRIHTLYADTCNIPLEMGAEFIHGNLPLTMKLLKEGGIEVHKGGGEWWQVRNGELEEEEHLVEHWSLFMSKLKDMKEDTTLEAFLQEHFNEDKYAGLRDSARRYAAGFDTADPARASAKALHAEWSHEDNDEQYRPIAGYHQLVQYLEAKCREAGVEIHTNTPVQQVKWGNKKVEAVSSTGSTYTGNRIIITVPLGVLQADENETGAIKITPALPAVIHAAKQMGMGSVIKILMQFSMAFWESEATAKHIGKDLDHLGFLFSKEAIPTWWTQYPKRTTLLTGWLGGDAATAMKDESDEAILAQALSSLANIFKLPVHELQQMLVSWKVVNWMKDMYSRGSYSYVTLHTKDAVKVLNTPVADTIYFAGEALYAGEQGGTVEAALNSGKDVANQISNES